MSPGHAIKAAGARNLHSGFVNYEVARFQLYLGLKWTPFWSWTAPSASTTMPLTTTEESFWRPPKMLYIEQNLPSNAANNISSGEHQPEPHQHGTPTSDPSVDFPSCISNKLIVLSIYSDFSEAGFGQPPKST